MATTTANITDEQLESVYHSVNENDTLFNDIDNAIASICDELGIDASRIGFSIELVTYNSVNED